MHKSATKYNKTLGKWCKNKHGASKIMDTLETYHRTTSILSSMDLTGQTNRTKVPNPSAHNRETPESSVKDARITYETAQVT
jgi:hypothetical protein